MNNINASATTAFNAVPSDTEDQAGEYKSIYVGGGGDVAISWDGGKTVIIYAQVPQGKDMNVTSARIMATDTNATLLVCQNW